MTKSLDYGREYRAHPGHCTVLEKPFVSCVPSRHESLGWSQQSKKLVNNPVTSTIVMISLVAI